MDTQQNSHLFWGLGLSDIEERRIVSAVPRATMSNWPADALPSLDDMEEETPFLIWIPERVWETLAPAYRSEILEWDPPQKALLLSAKDSDREIEDLLDEGFVSVLRPPLGEDKINETLRKANEVHSLYEDIVRMTREIALEREILSRKTDYLMFLNGFMARVAESLNPATIMTKARKDLGSLLPIISVQGIFWHESSPGHVQSEVFLDFHEDNGLQEDWTALMLESAERLSGNKVTDYQLTYLMDAEVKDRDDMHPAPGRLIMMPLKAGGKEFGCLALLTSEPVRLTKQQRDVLHSAVNHLGLALKNALLYREVKLRADHDGLTRIYNRQYFDERLVEELKRSQRYGQEMGLLLLDLDHFKVVNDTYGHQAGDMVLKEVGELLQATLRSTDFAARYGGEEFAVILPHTTEEHAWLLAERLRTLVEKLNFKFEGHNFTITVSIGVASLTPGSLSPNMDLLREADKALYLAKASGRNMVCSSEACSIAKSENSQQAGA